MATPEAQAFAAMQQQLQQLSDRPAAAESVKFGLRAAASTNPAALQASFAGAPFSAGPFSTPAAPPGLFFGPRGPPPDLLFFRRCVFEKPTFYNGPEGPEELAVLESYVSSRSGGGRF